MVALAALGAACGNQPGSPGPGDSPQSQRAVLTDMRDDCGVTAGRLLGNTVYPFDTFNGSATSRYARKADGSFGWYPLALRSETDPSDYEQELNQTGTPTDAARCQAITDLFTSEGGDQGGTHVSYELGVDYRFDFAFPANPGAAQAATTHPTQARARLTIDFTTSVQNGGLTEVKTLQSQSFDATLTCQTAFTIEGAWLEDGGDDTHPFCRKDDAGKTACLSYEASLTADGCDVRVPNAALQTLDGRTIRANLGGHLKTQAGATSAPGRQPRLLEISNVELL